MLVTQGMGRLLVLAESGQKKPEAHQPVDLRMSA